ncbi:hypothetical protein CWO91_16535 [Bradyrhizobium genosp. SA-3]|uniref:glycoside hydrolase family protein n=1 Tax=Bradyrhizobium genosp. SA-3 TaxID=508868 RepID=UPI00102954ED|nr:glycoside hydrolase family protein [Bradyrhizobium genosp. SA-3]RZN09635.1 hypothetical protein CWO91_16535 [Bradyrhizobium genosp. SA-3]
MIAATVAFTPGWEGMDKVARRDMIGTGHPITYCYGQTSEFGQVKVGQRFTKQECDEKLKESLPKYLDQIGPCVHRPVPTKAMSAILDAAYNAGAARICRSPMVARFNAGDVRGGCEAFDKWIVRSDGQVRTGLVARRAGEKYGDSRKSERALCLEGLSQPKRDWYTYSPLPKEEPKPPKSFWRRVWEWLWAP